MTKSHSCYFFLTSNLKFSRLYVLHTTHDYFCQFFLNKLMIFFGYLRLACNMYCIFMSHSKNQKFIFSKVNLTMTEISKKHVPFKIKFMHLGTLLSCVNVSCLHRVFVSTCLVLLDLSMKRFIKTLISHLIT